MTTAITATEQANRCLRCGRKLKVSSDYGRTCLRKIRAAALDEARADFTAEQQAKADELIRDGGLVPTTRRDVFQAVSGKGDATYLVHACACNCPAGLRARSLAKAA